VKGWQPKLTGPTYLQHLQLVVAPPVPHTQRLVLAGRVDVVTGRSNTEHRAPVYFVLALNGEWQAEVNDANLLVVAGGNEAVPLGNVEGEDGSLVVLPKGRTKVTKQKYS